MKLFVINLKRSTDRKDEISKQLLKIPNDKFESLFFDAIDGSKNEHLTFEKHFSKLAKFLRGRPLTNGELACFASHYSL